MRVASPARPSNGTVCGLAGLALWVASGCSCAQVLGVDDYHPPSGAPDPLASFINRKYRECAQCMRKSCEAEARTCAEDSQCDAFGKCNGACSDGACFNTCYENYPKTTVSGNYIGCGAEKCASCWLSAGAPWGPSCSDCFAREIRAADGGPGPVSACIADTDCAGLMGCFTTHCETWETNPQCRLDCAIDHPGASSKFQPFVAALSNCDGCNWGTHWDCVGKFGFIPPPPSEHQYSTVTVPGSGFAPGASVSLCGSDSGVCDASISAGPDGDFTVNWPVSPHYLRVDEQQDWCLVQLFYFNNPTFPSSPLRLPGGSNYCSGSSQSLFDDSTGSVTVVAADCFGSLLFGGADVTAMVELKPSSPPDAASTRTKKGEGVTFDHVPPDLYTVVIHPPDGKPDMTFGPVRVEERTVTTVYLNVLANLFP